MKACGVFVTKRTYSPPGPCENKHDIRTIDYDGERVPMCPPHRNMAPRHALTLIGRRP